MFVNCIGVFDCSVITWTLKSISNCFDSLTFLKVLFVHSTDYDLLSGVLSGSTLFAYVPEKRQLRFLPPKHEEMDQLTASIFKLFF